MVSLQKSLTHFLLIRNNGEIIRTKYFPSKNDIIFHIIYQIKIFKGTILNRLCHAHHKIISMTL